jgi:putative sterol carrier protein
LGTALYQPPGGDVTYTSVFGYTLGDLFDYGGKQLEKKMRAIGAPMPVVDVYVPPIEVSWPPPGGGLIAKDIRQRLTSAGIGALRRLTPSFAPGLGFMVLYLAFDAEASKDVDAVYEFRLSGRGGGTFHVIVRYGECRISTGPAQEIPNVVYELEGATWSAMVQGLVTGDEAVLLGRLRIKGDVVLARSFNDWFKPVGDAPIKAASLKPEEREAKQPMMKRVLRRLNPAA